MPCKTIICCDLDDFQKFSESHDNCPAGSAWDGTSCAPCAVPAAPSVTPSSQSLVLTWTVSLGLPYNVDRYSAGRWATLLTGTGTGALETHTDSSVVMGVAYLYRITVAVSEQCGYIEGSTASAAVVS